MTISPPPATLGATGLPAAAIAAIQAVLASHPQVECAVLYGSRAMGRQRRPSISPWGPITARSAGSW